MLNNKNMTPTPQWKRLRFYSSNKEDYRPIIFNPKYPWWVTGYNSQDEPIIVAYLPWHEELGKYWPEAYDVEYTGSDEIKFTDRFPKPDYFIES